MTKTRLKFVAPRIVTRTVPPDRLTLRTRDYLTDAEIAKLIEAAKESLGSSGCDDPSRLSAWPTH